MDVDVTILDNIVYVVTDDTGRVTVTSEEPSPGQAGITFEDEGVALGTRGTVNEVDFVGSSVAVTRSGDKITVNITGGSAGTGDVVGPASAVADNIAVFNGATGKIIKDGGSTIAAIIAAIPSLTGIVTTVPVASDGAAITLTNQPSAEAFFQSNQRCVQKFDATKYNFVRLMVNVVVLSASVNTPRMYIKYKTAYANGDAVSTFTTVGSGSSTEACSLASLAVATSDWIALDVNNKADVFWTAVMIGGDAAADPQVGLVHMQFKI